MKRLVGLLLVALVAVPAFLAPASPASAATPNCTTTKTKTKLGDGTTWWGELPATSGGSSTCLLYQGLSNSGVEALQFTLNMCFNENLAVDGVFGPLTRSALIRAQKAVGTAADGVYGPNTRDKFNAKLKWVVTRDLLPRWWWCTSIGT